MAARMKRNGEKLLKIGWPVNGDDDIEAAISQNYCPISGKLLKKKVGQAGRQEEMMMWEWTGAGHIGRLGPASCM